VESARVGLRPIGIAVFVVTTVVWIPEAGALSETKPLCLVVIRILWIVAHVRGCLTVFVEIRFVVLSEFEGVCIYLQRADFEVQTEFIVVFKVEKSVDDHALVLFDKQFVDFCQFADVLDADGVLFVAAETFFGELGEVGDGTLPGGGIGAAGVDRLGCEGAKAAFLHELGRRLELHVGHGRILRVHEH